MSSSQTIKKQPLTLQWYDVGENKNVSGYTGSGQLFAFLSCQPMHTELPKSTKLLQYIAKCENGVYISGNAANKGVGFRFSYIESNQASHLYSDLTVLETLVYSRELRADREKHTQPTELSVLRLLSEMGFKDWADLQLSKLAVWQRRMVLFATECIAGRDALFFDMPADDLDSSSALSIITALQRAARGGRIVVITASSLSFREYAMLDSLQILSSNGSVYFGTGAAAIRYFDELGRSPSPGASVTDFLFDLVNDAFSGGYADAHISWLEVHCMKRSREQVKAVWSVQSPKKNRATSPNIRTTAEISLVSEDISVRKSSAGSTNYGSSSCTTNTTDEYSRNDDTMTPSRSPGLLANVQSTVDHVYENYLSPDYSFSAIFAEKKTPTSLNSEIEISRQYEPADVRASDHSIGNVLDTFSSCVQNHDFCENEIQCSTPLKGCSKIGIVFLQFFQCLWRAGLIRCRNVEHIVSTWVFTGGLVVVGMGLLFFDSSSQQSRATFLVVLPFALVLLANNTNEYLLRDRAVFAYEASRGYYVSDVISPLASLLADLSIFHLMNPLLASALLYPLIGLQSSWENFFVYIHAVVNISLCGYCSTRAVSILFARGSYGGSSGTNSRLVTTFFLCLLFLYNGLLIPVHDSYVMKYLSFFYWGSNVLLWNEFGNTPLGVTFLEQKRISEESIDVANAILTWQTIILIVITSVASVSLIAKTHKVR